MWEACHQLTVVALLSLTWSMTGEAKANMESFGANVVITPRSEDVALSYGGVTVGGMSLTPWMSFGRMIGESIAR